jgi:hypothetical protein
LGRTPTYGGHRSYYRPAMPSIINPDSSLPPFNA